MALETTSLPLNEQILGSNAERATYSQTDYDEFVTQNLRRNYTGHFLHGVFGMTGFRLINTPTFVPSYIHTISGSDYWVGIATSLQQIGAIISPIIGAAKIEHREKVIGAAGLFGALMRVQLLALAVSAWFLAEELALYAAILFLFLFGFFLGPQRVAFQHLLAKVIPIRMRGRLQAWRNFIGGIVAAAVSYYAGSWFISQNVLGNGYATTFFVAFAFTTLGLIAIQTILREPVAVSVHEEKPLKARFKELPAIFTSDKGFRWFVVARLLAMGNRIGLPFIFLFAMASLGLSVEKDLAAYGSALAVFSIAFMAADTVSNLAWGYLSDLTGFRLTFILGVIVNILGMVLLLNANSYLSLVSAFALVGAAQSGIFMSATNIILEFGTSEDAPMRMALTNTAEGLMGASAPLIGTLVTVAWGYEATFMVTAICLVAALLVVVLRVDEPRNREKD